MWYWNTIWSLSNFFYKATLIKYKYLYATFNLFLDHICFIHDQLDKSSEYRDAIMINMVKEMKVKFDKYWGGITKMNMILFIFVLLNIRHKKCPLNLIFLELCSGEETEASKSLKSVKKKTLKDRYWEYHKTYFPSN